jgi:PKD repeat protein
MNKPGLYTLFMILMLSTIVHAQVVEIRNSIFPDLAWGCIEPADFDLDGDMDILITGRDESKLAVTRLYKNENGRFTELNSGIENLMLSSAVWADFNGDKYPDLLISGKTNKGEAVCQLYRNWKNGTFTVVNAPFKPVSSGSFSVADFDGDGLTEVLVTGRIESAGESLIYRNKGLFGFEETKIQLTGVYNSASAFADFNNDKYPDIIISGESGLNRYTKLYINQANGTFSEMENEITQLGNSSIVCADFNNDQNTDILISGLDVYGNEKTELYSNNGKLKFTNVYKTRGFIQADYVLPNMAYGTINSADLDGDEDLDLFFTGKGSQKLALVYLNESNFNFRKIENNLTGVYHSSAAIADFNDDTKPDIVYMGLNEESLIKTFICDNKGPIESITKTGLNQESPVIPAFSFSQANAGKPVNFVNQTKSKQAKPVSFKWDFGDGTFSTEDNPVHTYDKEGRNTVILTARIGDIVATASKVIFVKPHFTETINFSEKEMLILNSNALKMLKDYETLTNRLGSASGANEKESTDLREQIINLFLNRQVYVYNDLDPTGKSSRQKEIETYTSDLILLYPDGIKVGLDLQKARMTGIRQHGKSLYSVDFIVSKRIDGNYDNKMDNEDNYKLAFRFAFNNEKSDFGNLKIVGVRDYYEQAIVADEKSMEEINAAQISKAQLEQIDISTKNLLNDYIRNLSLIGNSKEDPSDKDLYQQAFVELFNDSSATIYNDIDPDNKENAFLPADYIKNYRSLYPEGIININLNLDSAKYKPALEENGIFYRYIYADKNFSGFYKLKSKHIFSENLAFKLQFKKQGNSFQDFKIASVDQSAMNFYQSSDGISTEDTTSFQIPIIERTGFSFGIGLNGGLGSIDDATKLSTEIGGEQIWTKTSGLNYSVGIEANYFFNNHFGFRTGIFWASYKTDYSINDEYDDGTNTSLDKNGNEFIKNLEATDYNEQISMSTIDIPLQLQWISSEPDKIGLFLNAGANLSIPVSSSQHSSGDIHYKGYYPANAGTSIETIDIEALGFYNSTNTESENSFSTTSYTLSLMASAGIYIPIGYFANLLIGPRVLWGITDLSGDDQQLNVFNEEVENPRIKLRSFGLGISFNYKF